MDLIDAISDVSDVIAGCVCDATNLIDNDDIISDAIFDAIFDALACAGVARIADEHTHTHMGDDTMETIERCDFCDNTATMECPLCGATVCDYHITHDPHVCNEYMNMVDECIATHEHERFNDAIETRLTRYIANRNKRGLS